MATANILSIKNAGLVAYDGSATFNGRTLSAGSSKLSITNGSGVSGNPTVDAVEANFTLNNIGGTLGVSKGGTGATTLTSNSLLLGNGTSAVSALGLATNGQIPIGSTGNAPVLATITGGSNITVTNGSGSIQIDSVGNSANAGSVVDIVDDLMGEYSILAGGSTAYINNLGFKASFSGAYSQLASAGRPGVCKCTATVATDTVTITTSAVGDIILGNGQVTVQWWVKIPTLSDGTDSFRVRMGLCDGPQVSTISSGCWFDYIHSANSGKWVINCGDGTTSSANTNSTADTNWHVYKVVVNSGGTSVSFYIDGVEVSNSPITTHIPTVAVSPFCQIRKTLSSTLRSIYVDLFTLNYTLSTPR